MLGQVLVEVKSSYPRSSWQAPDQCVQARTPTPWRARVVQSVHTRARTPRRTPGQSAHARTRTPRRAPHGLEPYGGLQIRLGTHGPSMPEIVSEY